MINLNAAGYAIRHGAKIVLKFVKRKAPQIMISLGVCGFVGTAVATGSATLKAKDILDERDAGIAVLEAKKTTAGYSEEETDKEIRELKKKTRWKLVKTYLPPFTLAGASTCLIFGGTHVFGKWTSVALGAAYEAQMKLAEGRERVVSEYGEEAGLIFDGKKELHKLPTIETEVTEKREDDEWVTVDWLFCEETCGARYGGSGCWHDDAEMNLATVINKMQHAFDRLKCTGKLTVNDIIVDEFGADAISNGDLGLLWDDKYGYDDVSFGLEDLMTEEGKRRFLRQANPNILLRFKVRKQPITPKFDEINARRRAHLPGKNYRN